MNFFQGQNIRYFAVRLLKGMTDAPSLDVSFPFFPHLILNQDAVTIEEPSETSLNLQKASADGAISHQSERRAPPHQPIASGLMRTGWCKALEKSAIYANEVNLKYTECRHKGFSHPARKRRDV